MDITSNFIIKGQYSIPPYLKPKLTSLAIISSISAIANAIFCASNAGWITLGTVSIAISIFPAALPIALCTLSTAAAFLSLAALYILHIKEKPEDQIPSPDQKVENPSKPLLEPQSNIQTNPQPIPPPTPDVEVKLIFQSEPQPLSLPQLTPKEIKSKEREIAMTQMTAAANGGDPEAMYKLGLHFLKESKHKDIEVGLKWLMAAEENHHAEAKQKLGQYYFDEAKKYIESSGPLAVEKELARLYQKAAERGHGEAQYEYGRCHVVGKGVGKNEQLAMQWLEQASKQNFDLADLELGILYAKSKFQEDRTKGMNLIKNLALKNCPKAQYVYGLGLKQGIGGDADLVEGFKWIQKAYEQNYPDAAAYLGSCYYSGRNGCQHDRKKALEYYRNAVSLGSLTKQAFKNLFPLESLSISL